MSVLLNGESVPAEGAPDAAEALRRRVRSMRLVPTRLRLDGREVPLDALATLTGEHASVELEATGLEAAVERAYGDAARCLDSLRDSVESACESLLLGRVREGMDAFGALCRGLDAFFRLLLPLDALTDTPAGQGWTPDLERFRPLLEGTSEALAQRDWVLVNDSLRYEWAPALRLCRDRIGEAREAALRRAAGAQAVAEARP